MDGGTGRAVDAGGRGAMNSARRWAAIEKLMAKAREHFDKLPTDDRTDHADIRRNITSTENHAHEMTTVSRAESDRQHRGVR